MKARKIRTILCLLLCLALLAGCSGKQTANNDDGSSSSAVTEASSESNTEENSISREDPPVPAEPAEFTQDDYVADYMSVSGADCDMTVTVNAPAGYSAEDVLAGMTLRNLTNPVLTDPDEADLLDPDYLVAEGGPGSYTISCVNGFNPGETYQIRLDDLSLTFDGQADEVRLYNITTAGEETHNMRLSGNVHFLNADELNEQEADTALRFDGLFRFDYQSGALAAHSGKGSFVYEQGAFNKGNVIAVYQGEKPDERSLEDNDQEVAYIRITSVEDQGGAGARYDYENAAPEEVLFTPDIIPVNRECGQDEGESGSVSLSGSELMFTSDGEFSAMGLDENTLVEAGDYLAFYGGSNGAEEVEAYAEITEIVWTENDNGEDTADISYVVTDLDDVIASADLYHEGTLTEEQIRESYNEEAIKAGVIEDLTNNGYLAESSFNLAQTALETDEAQELFGDVDLEDLTFYYGEDEGYSLSGKDYKLIAEGKASNGVEVKGDPDVSISPNIVHFAGSTGYGMGVRVEAYSRYIITIRGSELAQAALRINIAFFFETEFALGYTADATSVWKKWWIFPYLYDYNVSGSSTCGVYVGAGFTASATLFKNTPTPDDEANAAGIPWPDEVDRTPGSEKVMKIAEYIQEFGKKHESIFPKQDTGGGTLSKKYAAFIYNAEKSWVDIINENIFDWNGCVDPFHIIAFRIKADFIVAAQLNAAIGVAGNYERAYRNTFSFMLFHKDRSGAETEETLNSTFRADVYIFGAMGIRAGLRITVAVGLFDARLDSIGIELEAGVYERFWGFFYAGVEITDVGRGAETDAYYAGGMLLEAGGYYGFTFVAQAGDGAIEYRKYMGGGEYPFWGAGIEALVNDFNYPEDYRDLDFFAEFTKTNSRAVIPAEAFMMTEMSIKDGSVSTANKGGSNAEELFDITFSDPNFSYVYDGGRHMVERKDAPGGTGTVDMTLTWKERSFEQLSNELSRTIRISWVANKTTMKFLNKDGSIFFMTTKPEGTHLTAEDLPSGEPVAAGYEFTGWLDTDGSELKELPKVMPDVNTEYRSSWTGVPVSVNVRYYMPYGHDSSGKMMYLLDDTDRITDLFRFEEAVDDVSTVLAQNHLLRTLPDYDFEGKAPYKGYRISYRDSELSAKSVNYDGSTTFRIYMEWDQFTVTFNDGAGNKTTHDYYPGVQIDFPQLTRQGYIFTGWLDEDGEIVNGDDPPVCTGNNVFTATWEQIPPTLTVRCQVKVRSWGMNYYWNTISTEEIVNDSYEITVQKILDMVGPEGYVFDQNNTSWKPQDTVNIAEDGTTVITLRFKAGE